MRTNLLSFLLSLTLLFSPASGKSQTNHQSDYCATTILQKLLFESNPYLLKKHKLYDNLAASYLIKSSQKEITADYVLPVVVHIIHGNGTENISDALVQQGIADLNAAYANIGYYNPETGVDTRIQFCLAKRTVDGSPTTGITRNTSVLTSMTLETDDLTVKNINRWDPTKYINIWLVKEICSNHVGCGVAGYATFPASHGMGTDGLMIEARWFGSSPGNSGAIIHEMGHYLGLYHTFQGGCVNNDCLTDGDHVCDTPPDQSTIVAPCDAAINSCSTDTDSGFTTDQNDLIQDYMDYGNWDCYSTFTQGQADRMQYFIENVRSSLLESNGCEEPCQSEITASFTASSSTNVGETINFHNTTVNGTNYEWQIDGVTFSTAENPSYTFTAVGTYEITLIVTNADPNCIDVYDSSITVVCPVEANFSTSNPHPTPGGTVDFTNESINGTTYEWAVDGVPISSSENFSYTFPNPGAFQVCLTTGNGICNDKFCRFILVSDSSTGECVGTFIRKIGNEGENEDPHAILSIGNGKFIMGFGKDDRSVFSIIDQDGNVESSKSFDFMTGDDFFRVLATDSEGNLIAHARDEINANTDNFIIKYDMTSNVVLWSKEYPTPTNSRMERIIEIAPGGNYLIVGFTAGRALIMEINRNTGDIVWQKNYAVGPHFLMSDAVISGGFIYISGSEQRINSLNKIRASLTKVDLSGNLIWNKIYLKSTGGSARNYANSLVVDGDNIVAVSRGNINGSNLTESDAQLFKTDLSGTIIFGKNYHIAESNTAGASHVMNLPDGYIFLGSFFNSGDRDIFFIKTDKSGNIIWAKSIGTTATESSIRFEMYNGFIYFFAKTTGYDTGNNYDCLFGKMSTDGEISGNGCDLVADIHVEVTDITYEETTEVTTSTPSNPLNNFPITEGDVNLEVENIPGCECEEFSNPGSEDCVGTFIRKIGNEGENEEGKILLSSGTGNFFCGGKKDGDAFLFTIDQDGNFLSGKTFDLNSGSYFIDNILMDNDNNLILLARDRTNSSTDNFIIKYNHEIENIIWIKEYPMPSYTRLEGIIELTSGNYLISGFIGPSGAQGNAILIEINHNSGDLIWQKDYSLGSFELFLNPLEYNGAIYAGGFERANGGLDKIRASLTKLDQSGNIIWNRIYFNSPAEAGRTYLTDIEIINNSIVALSRGNLMSDSYSNSDFQFSTLNLDGHILWSKNYHAIGGTYTQGRMFKKIPDGYIINGRFQYNGSPSFFFARIDLNGNLVWSKVINTTFDDDGISFDIFGDHIYFFGKTKAYDSAGNYDSVFGKMSFDGEVSGNGCELVTDFEIEVTDIIDPYDGEISLEVSVPSNPLNDFTTTPIDVSVTVENIPGCECDEYSEPTDSCGLKTDATIFINSFECQNQSVQISITVCNEGVEDLPANTPISFYAGNPTLVNAPLLTIIYTEEKIERNSCLAILIPSHFQSGTEVFAVVNDNGMTPRPFTLDDDFGNTGVPECNYPNNIGNITITYSTPTLDLGPDILICDNAVIELNAGDQFVNYQWSDGTTEQSLTTSFEGTYSVTVTDACGIEQTDNVQIQFDPITQVDLGVDTLEVCPGDSISFSVAGYTGYQWFPEDNFSCTDCDSITQIVDTSILVVLVANDDLGCFTTDSVYVNVVDTISKEETINYCPGGSVTISDSVYYEPTIITQWIESSVGCDTLKTIIIEEVDESPDASLIFSNIECTHNGIIATLSICNYGNIDLPLGTPVTFYSGNPILENAPVISTIPIPQVITTGNCISISIELDINSIATVFAIANDNGTTPTPFNLEDALPNTTIFECDFSQNIGNYTFSYTPPELNLGEDLIFCENESVILDAGSGFDTYLWSDNSTEQFLLADSSGIYSVTTTDACGNIQTDSMEIQINPVSPVDLGLDTIDICRGDTISFSLNGYESYQWMPSDVFDCDTCGTVTSVIGDSSLLIILQVENDFHCKATDSIFIHLVDTIFTEETIPFCYGDTLIYQGTAYWETTIFTEWIPSFSGCDTFQTTRLLRLEELTLNINPTKIICAGSCTQLSINANRAIDSVRWTGNSIDKDDIQTPIVCPEGSEAGITAYLYDVEIIDTFGCNANATTVVQVTEPLSVAIEKDTTVCRTKAIEFKAITNLPNRDENGVITLIWSENPGNPRFNTNISFDSLAVMKTTPLDISGQYVFEVTMIQKSPDGLEDCLASDQVVIRVEDCDDCGVYIPNVFSPNGDNINDTFFPFIICELEDFNMKIFDRWGGKVYETNDIKSAWDGSFRGKPAPIDVYVFVISGIVAGEERIFAGDITLIR